MNFLTNNLSNLVSLHDSLSKTQKTAIIVAFAFGTIFVVKKLEDATCTSSQDCPTRKKVNKNRDNIISKNGSPGKLDVIFITKIYSLALSILCMETWFAKDPILFSHLGLKNPPAPYPHFAQIFASWHAGGVVFSCIINSMAQSFRAKEKCNIALANGILFLIWGTINTHRALYSPAFYSAGIAIHGLFGGCGIVSMLNLYYYFKNKSNFQSIDIHES